jgi:hypothetical protein
LKFLLRRDKAATGKHLLETEEFREQFYGGDLGKIATSSAFSVRLKLPPTGG